MMSAIKAFFAWWVRFEQAMDSDPVFVLERRVRRLEDALAQAQATGEPSKAQ